MSEVTTLRSYTDTDYLFHILEDGAWHSQDDILRRSQETRGYGMTVHSRAADLRKRGHTVENMVMVVPPNRRRQSFYRLVIEL